MSPELSSCSFDSFEIIKIPEPGEKCYKNLLREFSKNQGSALIIVYTKIGAEKFHEDKVNIERRTCWDQSFGYTRFFISRRSCLWSCRKWLHMTHSWLLDDSKMTQSIQIFGENGQNNFVSKFVLIFSV